MTFDWHTFKASCVLHLSIINTAMFMVHLCPISRYKNEAD